MSKTLLISEIFPPRHGGSGRWFIELYSRLPREDYLIAAGEVEGSAATDEGLRNKLQVSRIPLSSSSWGLRSLTGLRFYWSAYRHLKTLVKAHKIRTVHCGRCLPEGVMGLMLNLRFRLPYLCYVHGEDVQTASASRELSWLIRRVFGRASRLIANSHNTANTLCEQWGVDRQKIEILHPGMDANRFVPAAPDPAFRQSMGWTDRTVILTVGRLQRRKGHDMLIGALPKLLERHPKLLYAIVGDGDQRERLESLVADAELGDHVAFLGELSDEDMIRCYQQCTLFALPNRTDGYDIEGFGMVLAEAQSCAKAVLAGDSGGTRETMIVGESGLIVDCTRADPLADALDGLLSDPGRLQSMGKQGREHVSKHLDWAPHAERAQQIFGRLR